MPYIWKNYISPCIYLKDLIVYQLNLLSLIFLCPFTFNCNFNYSCRLPYPSNSVQLLPHLLKVYEEDPRTAAGQLSLSHSCPPENTGEI